MPWLGREHRTHASADLQASEILLPDDVRERRVGPIEANQCQAKRNRQWLVRLGIADDGKTGHRALRARLRPNQR